MTLLSRLRSWFSGGPELDGGPDPGSRWGQSPQTPGRADTLTDRGPSSSSLSGAASREEEGAAAREPPAHVQRLALVGLLDGPTVEEAIAVLRQVRGTVLEATAVTWALRGAGTRTVPDPVRVAVADILASRGDDLGALRVVEGISSTPGLILAADLHAAAGQLARAVGTIERVLARDLDAPGARERHQRWSLSLGYTRRPARRLDEATIVAPQTTTGPFRLLREAARGGAGAVYEAEDEVLGRRVAFKVYHGRGKDRAVLEREARTAVALAGPGVLRVLDADPAQGWVALEWVPRGSVRDMLRHGDLATLAPIGRWARPLARALARIHAQGLVHADVKPANVLLRQPHDPVLGDFGIARPAGAPDEGGGSPGYLSPERLAGRPSDPRDDVYGYGRVLEDVIHRLEEAGSDASSSDFAAFRAVALTCIGPDEGRPESGAELVRRLP
jgi:eukaryotic-like serine/threonine-protein kinase